MGRHPYLDRYASFQERTPGTAPWLRRVMTAMGGAGLDPFLEQHWKSGTSPIIRHSRMLETRLKTPADLLAYYRDLNSPATQRDFVAVDYKRAMSTPSAGNYGRTYLAWWETRNLRMVANIRAAFGNRAGARVLNIVGASHKPYYEAYLAMMSDVKLVDAATVLR